MDVCVYVCMCVYVCVCICVSRCGCLLAVILSIVLTINETHSPTTGAHVSASWRNCRQHVNSAIRSSTQRQEKRGSV
jgi:hypothetical protein